MSEKKYLYWASLGICSILYFIWPMTHTMALQKLLLLSGAAAGVLLWLKSEDRKLILKSAWFMYSGLLLLWVVFHAALLSQNGREAWGELLGQWLPAYLALLAGVGCALAGRQISPRVFRFYLIAVLAAQPVLYLFITLVKSVQIGHLAIGYWGMSDHKLSLTFYADLLAAASCAKIIDAVKSGTATSIVYFWLLPIALAFYVAFISDSLNGIILVSGCLLLTTLLLIYQARIKIAKGAFIATALLAVCSLYAISTFSSLSAKWENFASDTRVAISIDTNTNWSDISRLGLPQNDLGIQVKESYYLRMAYATAGLHTIIEHPWGYGVTRHAFERLIQQERPDAHIANSHNAYIDLVSAVGFPALLLLVMVLVSVFRQLKRTRSEWTRPAVWMIGIMVAHWMIDPLSRDHYFETFLFLIGFFSVLTIERQPDYAGQK